MAIERTVVITGAASGIGAATARRLAAPGTALLLTTRANGDGLAAAADAARAAGATVETMLGDLTDEATAAALVATARDRFGRIDGIVSNAGKAAKAKVADIAGEDVLGAARLAALPFLALANAARADLIASPAGRIVAVSSFVANDFGINGTLFPATAAGKAALEALVKALAFELAPTGVTVNAVAPGFTRKDGGHAALGAEAWTAAAKATPSGRIAEPQDIAAAIAFFLSAETGHVTGQVLRVDGGLSLL